MTNKTAFLLGNYLQMFLVLLICINFVSILVQSQHKFTNFNYWSRFPSLEKEYNSSQYVSKNPKGWIPDEIADSYNGGALIRGENPVLIVPDTPPLGKYLIGLSALIFNNENIITAVCGLLSLVFMYAIGKQLFTYPITSLIPPLIFSFEPMFLNQFYYSPMFDVIQLSFLLATFFFFNKALENRRSLLYFSISMFFVGCFISTKFFITGLIIVASMGLVLLVQWQKKKLFYFFATLPITIIVLLTSYFRVFAYGYSLRELLGVQKWIFLYHKSQLILPLTVWPLLLFNKWYVWFGDKPIISDPQWRLSWPLITIGSFITIGLYLLRKIPHKKEVEVLMAWITLYLLFFSFGQITSRYFVILLPILYIVSIFGIESLLRKYKFISL